MTVGGIQTALVVILGLLLIAAAVTDLRSRTISNVLTATVALMAPLYWWASGLSVWPDMVIQLGLGIGMFGLCVIPFLLNAMAGGDVKLIGAVALWVPLPPVLLKPTPLPSHDLVMLLVVMSLIGGLVSIPGLIRKYFTKSEVKPEVPYGVAIALGGLWAIGEPYLNHFV